MAVSFELRMTRGQDAVKDYQTYTMKVQVLSVSAAENEEEPSPKLFVFHASATAGADRFSHIASAVDLEELPVDAPSDTQPYYRMQEVTLVFRRLDELLRIWGLIQEDVQALTDALNTGLSDPITDTVTIS